MYTVINRQKRVGIIGPNQQLFNFKQILSSCLRENENKINPKSINKIRPEAEFIFLQDLKYVHTDVYILYFTALKEKKDDLYLLNQVYNIWLKFAQLVSGGAPLVYLMIRWFCKTSFKVSLKSWDQNNCDKS